jgi:hypothetical protein
MSNQKKNDTLGMPYGTASNRLRKILLFECLKRHSENVCFRCDQEILKVEELSIEHKKPWEGLDPKLFWDLENVTFSHLGCNRPLRPTSVQRIFPPEGAGWCAFCKSMKPIGDMIQGNHECKSCKRIRNEEYKNRFRAEIV